MSKYILAAILVLSISVVAQVNDTPEITVDELKGHIGYLASDELEGRKPGTAGIEKAAEYIVQQLEGIDAKKVNGSYFQPLEIVTDLKAGENNRFVFADVIGTLNENFTPLNVSENGAINANVVFVGYGFQFDEDSVKWNDYAGVNAEGKWVMILRGSPSASGHGPDPYANYSSLRKKILTARDNKAAGVLFISGKSFDEPDNLIELSFSRRETSAGLPAMHIKRTLADAVIGSTDNTIEKLEASINESKSPSSFEIEFKLDAQTDLVKTTASTNNVVAVIEGNDPLLKNEYVILGAHYDHLGYGGIGSGSRAPDRHEIHNGADDNASGTAAIIEIFEQLASNKDKLKRSILFMAFTAEEMGLIGSKYFVDNPFLDLENIHFMFNLDMVGRLVDSTKNLTIGGTGTAVGLEEMLKKHVDATGLNVKFSSEGYGPSDHASFYAKDIPVAFFFTGVHDDYHTPEDDAHLINYEGEKVVADLVYNIAMDLVNMSDDLVYQEAGPKEQRSASRRFKVTLGIMPDVASSDTEGLRADAVIEGRPAHNAGMQKGDIIVAMEGKTVNDIYDYMNRLGDFKPGQRISVDVMRDGKKVILIVDL
jgi:aminopeptidase YwaD